MKRRLTWPVLVLALCAVPGTAHAMHITEGILPAPWAGLWFLVAIPFVAWGLRDLQVRSRRTPFFKPMVGLVGAAVFVISCMPIPVPVAGTTSHPTGTGLAAILIGPPLTVVVASIALLLQALFLAHGGLTTLGANIVSMGIVGGLTGYGVFHAARRLRLPSWLAAFLAGLVSDWATYAVTADRWEPCLRPSPWLFCPRSSRWASWRVWWRPGSIASSNRAGPVCWSAWAWRRAVQHEASGAVGGAPARAGGGNVPGPGPGRLVAGGG
jgi:cobalt/nickel transport system permease protein